VVAEVTGSWIEATDHWRSKHDEVWGQLLQERRGQQDLNKVWWEFLEEVGHTDDFVEYLRRVRSVAA
jgi:hypothetical protein